MGAGRRAAALLLAASAAVSLLAAEGAVRLLRPGFVAGPDPEGNPFWTHDPELGWFHRPGERGTFSRPEFSHRVAVNAMGFRDRERDPARRAALRIAVVGDSFAWGHGVEEEEVFTRILEGSLRDAEVWNLAVSAYSTDQELLLFRRVGSVVRPDLVLVILSRNDFEGNVSGSYGAYPKPRLVERGGSWETAGSPVPEPSIPRRLGSWIRRRSALANGLAWAIAHGLPRAEAPAAGRDEQVRVTLGILDLFAGEVRAAGARFAVALAPSVAHVYFTGPAAEPEIARYEAVVRWGRDRGVPVLDLGPAFREVHARTGAWLHHARDKHWNASGHRVAAEALAGLLARAGLLGGSAPGGEAETAR